MFERDSREQETLERREVCKGRASAETGRGIQVKASKGRPGWAGPFKKLTPDCPRNLLSSFGLMQKREVRLWLTAGAFLGPAVIHPRPHLAVSTPARLARPILNSTSSSFSRI